MLLREVEKERESVCEMVKRIEEFHRAAIIDIKSSIAVGNCSDFRSQNEAFRTFRSSKNFNSIILALDRRLIQEKFTGWRL